MCCRGSGRAGSAPQRILRAGAEPSTRRRRAGSARRRQFSGAAGQQDAPCRGADRAGSTRRRQFSGAAGQQHAPCRSADRAGSARRRRFSGAAAGTPEVAPAPRCCRAARLRWPTVCRSSGGTDFASPRAVVLLLERGIVAVLRELRGTPACRPAARRPTLPPWPAPRQRQPGGTRRRNPGAPSRRRFRAASPSACRAPESTASKGAWSIGIRLPRPPGSESRPLPIMNVRRGS